MNFSASSKFTRFATSWWLGLTFLAGSAPAQADTFDTILREVAVKSGFTAPERTHSAVDKSLVPLGRRFFESKHLSLNGDVSCRDCHLDEFGSGDGIPLAVGIGGSGAGSARAMGDGAIIPRNTLPLWGRGGVGFDVFFWDGRVDFTSQEPVSPFGSDAPSSDPLITMVHLPAVEIREMLVEDAFIAEQKQETADSAAEVFKAIVERLKREEAAAIGQLATSLGIETDEVSFVHVATALANFVRDAFRVKASPFHRYVFEGEPISDEAKRGGLLFFGKGKCATCHSGPYFSDFGFHAVASIQLGFGKNGFGIDYGRYNATHDPADLYRFRTPPLLNVAQTAPYGHSGSLATLEEAVIAHFDPLRLVDPAQMSPLDRHEFYKRMISAAQGIIRIGYLDDQEVAQVVAFLHTLSY